ncbi:MAG: hypothetical protein E5W86_00605 [Mesorhizobium sp.]|nr:MAG: hypothetical protein E5W86_00605 [Mesorhizobium sp.]
MMEPPETSSHRLRHAYGKALRRSEAASDSQSAHRDMQYDLPFLANQTKFAADPKHITTSDLRSVIRRDAQTAAAGRRAG